MCIYANHKRTQTIELHTNLLNPSRMDFEIVHFKITPTVTLCRPILTLPAAYSVDGCYILH